MHPLASRMHLLAWQTQLTGQARRRFALGNATPQEHKRRWAWSGCREHVAGQQRVGPITGLTAVGRKMPMFTEDAPLWAATVRACEPSRMEAAFEPDQLSAVVQKFGDWEVYYGPKIPCSARWLHMSRKI